MEMLNKLKEQGWYLTEEGLRKIESATPGADVKKIIATALDWDFREIAGGALITTKKEDTLPGRVVLQIQKIRNIAAPKANEESKAAPRLLQVEFSDGQSVVLGLELEPIPALSFNVPPGTKVFFRPERLQLMQGFIVLKSAELQILGGRVENLVEKWELARTMLKYARSGRRVSGSSGPPPWIAFGKKLDVKDSLPNERQFKSLQAAMDKDKESTKENEEFNAMRTEAIAEATKAGAKKTFGGGNQQIVDHNVKKILEKGYNEEDAKHALRSTNNNLERALYNLKRRDENKRNNERSGTSSVPSSTTNGRGGRSGISTRELGGGKRGAASCKEEAAAAKPASNVSLFDFLTNKLPGTETTTNTTTTKAASSAAPSQPAVSNNSSFNANNNRIEKSKSDVAKSNASNTSNNNSNGNSNKPPAQDSAAGRPKFENNISSSFAANRTTPGPRSGRQEREPYNAAERQTNTRYSNASGGRGSGRGGGRGSYQSGNRGQYDDNNTNRSYQQRSGGAGGVVANESTSRSANSNFSGNNNRNNRNSHERTPAGSSGHSGNEKQQPHSTGGYDSRRNQDYQNKGHEKPRYNQKDNSNNYQGNNNRNYDASSSRQQTTQSTGNNNNDPAPISNVSTSGNASDISKLVESTSKLKIDKTRDSGRNQQRSQNRPQQHHQQPPQQQQQHQYSSQQPMQPVMTQQYQQPATAASPHQMHQQMISNQVQAQSNFNQMPNGFAYDPSKIIGFQSKETNEYAMTLLKSQGVNAVAANAGAQQQPPPPQPPTHYVPSASPLHMQPPPPQQPPSPFPAPTAFILPTPRAVPQMPPAPNTYGIMPHGDSWMWKIGDLCLAKYWDDGRYYEAEITGISASTCVVLFLDYGNYEEVLKSDCLPLTDVNHRPINQYSGHPGHMTGIPPAHQPLSRMHLANVTQNRGLPNRHRGERQVYVPPPKRDN